LNPKELIDRYYNQLWNRWDDSAIDELIEPAFVFRGSLGTTVHGLAEFRMYVARVRAAFPDFHNQIEELVGEDTRVAARLTYTGSHRGDIWGFPATNEKIQYGGMAIFECSAEKILRGYVLGDVEGLKEQLAIARFKIVGERLSTPDIAIRPASDADKVWAAALMARSEPWITLGRTEEAARAVVGSASHFLVVAEGPQKENCGFILLHPEGVAGSPYIRSVAVAERFRSAGVGKQLLHFAECVFAGKSRHIFLCVSSFNQRARSLYERCGYVVVGELHDYVIVGASELLMYKALV
jgi:steroid delta-isomerase-like uncharacterized protein